MHLMSIAVVRITSCFWSGMKLKCLRRQRTGPAMKLARVSTPMEVLGGTSCALPCNSALTSPKDPQHPGLVPNKPRNLSKCPDQVADLPGMPLFPDAQYQPN